MSYGDEIMASGHARAEAERLRTPVHIVDRHGRPRWSDLWNGLFWISRPDEKAGGSVQNGPGCRPYIRYPFSLETGCRYSGWRASEHLGSIALTPEEIAFAFGTGLKPKSFVVIEPDIALDGNPNKGWGRQRWEQLVDVVSKEMRPGTQFVRLLAPGRTPLRSDVRVVSTPSFRHAAAVLAIAQAAVLPEGGLHHAAAALGVPAVVLFGGSPSVDATGYPMHVNLADQSGHAGCGAWRPCDHCKNYWLSLLPEDVGYALCELLYRTIMANAVRVPDFREGACRPS